MKQQEGGKVRPFTGYHAAAILIAFFAVVVGVNLVMARFAISTFGGTVVENSYVASQKFNGWLAEARREKELGWTISPPAREGDHLVLNAVDALDAPLAGAAIMVVAEHPLGRLPIQRLRFIEAGPGLYHSVEPLPAGRWKLRVRIQQARRELDLAFEIS
ncbi:MAG: FixH family protein [Sphingobium sp.]